MPLAPFLSVIFPLAIELPVQDSPKLHARVMGLNWAGSLT